MANGTQMRTLHPLKKRKPEKILRAVLYQLSYQANWELVIV